MLILFSYLYSNISSTAQTEHASGGDWQEEVYQKVILDDIIVTVTLQDRIWIGVMEIMM